MNLLEKTDEEIIKIAEPFWNNLIISSNKKDYSGFTRDFSAEMLYGANEIEIGKQWSTNELLVNTLDIIVVPLLLDPIINIYFKAPILFN